MAQLPKKRELKTVKVPEGLPAPKKTTEVSSAKETGVRPVKTVKGEVVRDKLSAPKETKRLSSPPKLLSAPSKTLETAKTVGKGFLRRAGAIGAAVTAAELIHSALTSKKDKIGDQKKTPNVESTGKSTKIDVSKKAVTPSKKPSAPKTSPVKSKGKSETRKAFEKEFAKQRRSGAKEFTFRGKRYNTKLAK